MAIKKKLTKRQILNELLVVEEKKAKYEESLARVYKRGERLDDRYNELAEQLETISNRELRKAGLNPYDVTPEPILFKQHVFAIVPSRYGNGKSLQINSVKAVK